MKRIACSGIGLVLTLGLLGLSAGAQDQGSQNLSLGDYARQVKKAPGATSKPKVFDNDNLPTSDKLSIVGPTPASTGPTESEAKPSDSTSAAPAAADTKSTTESKAPDGKAAEVKAPDGTPAAPKTADAKPASEEKAQTAAPAKPAEQDEAAKQAAWKQWADRIAAQKEAIDLLGRELDVLQREYQIRAAAMYADAGNRMRNSGDWDKQDTQYKQQIADKQKALDEAKQKLEDLGEDARKAGVPASVREP